MQTISDVMIHLSADWMKSILSILSMIIEEIDSLPPRFPTKKLKILHTPYGNLFYLNFNLNVKYAA